MYYVCKISPFSPESFEESERKAEVAVQTTLPSPVLQVPVEGLEERATFYLYLKPIQM